LRKTFSRSLCSPLLPCCFPPEKSLASALRNRLLYNHARTPLVSAHEIFRRYPAAPTSHPKVFGEADNESLDGGTARILRGPLPGTWSCDSSGGPRARRHGTPPGLVPALPRGFAGPRSRGRERLRCAHDAARTRLADDG